MDFKPKIFAINLHLNIINKFLLNHLDFAPCSHHLLLLYFKIITFHTLLNTTIFNMNLNRNPIYLIIIFNMDFEQMNLFFKITISFIIINSTLKSVILHLIINFTDILFSLQDLLVNILTILLNILDTIEILQEFFNFNIW